MATTEQQTRETYHEADLRGLKRDEVRKIAAQHNISNVKSLKKDQLI